MCVPYVNNVCLIYWFSACGSMITYLQKLKDTWESSKDPEKEILQKIWRFVPAACCPLYIKSLYYAQAKQNIVLA
jgi:hypothetical protein